MNYDTSFGEIKQDNFNFDSIESYFRQKEGIDTDRIITEKTCNDLDFREVFMFADRTCSRIGQQYLYSRMRTIPEKSEVGKEERLIKRIAGDSEFRATLESQLATLNRSEVYNVRSLFQEKLLSPPKGFFMVRILSVTTLITLFLIPFSVNFFYLFIGLFLTNMVIHYLNKSYLNQYIGVIPQLLNLKKVAVRLMSDPDLKEINPGVDRSVKSINEVRNRMFFFRVETVLQNDFAAMFWSVLEIIKATFLIEPILLFSVLKILDTKRQEVEDVYTFVGKVDYAYSVASLRAGLDVYCIPDIAEEGSLLDAEDLFHPLITGCVTNSIKLSGRSVLLTGSNMSGKTTFIRSVGISVICGMTLNTCFASSMAFSRCRIHSAIRISDDLLNEKSYYFEEVLTVKEMVTSSTNGNVNLFLLDEIFKGTNTVERIAAGKAVLSSIAKNGNIVFVSTHDIELTDLLSEEYDLYHFSEIVNDKNVDFDYMLKKGALTSRNAIRILQINGYPAEVVNEAMELSRVLDERQRKHV